MRNKYKGTCYWCGNLVEPNQGHFEQNKSQWLTIHTHCVFERRKRGEELMERKNQCFWIRGNEKLFYEIRDIHGSHSSFLAAIMQNDMIISVEQINEWKDIAKQQLPKDLYERVLEYLRLQYLISRKSPRIKYQ